MKTSYKVAGAIASLALLITPLAASAQTDTGVSSQIQSLLSQISALESQLKSLVQSSIGSTTSMWEQNMASSTPGMGAGMPMPCGSFNRDLSIGSRGDDVSQLQDMLSGDGFFDASSTGFFGALTAKALGAFQVHFGISTSTGFFGPLTRAFFGNHCDGMATSTRPMPLPSSWNQGSSTPPSWGWNGSSTPVMQPCQWMNASTTGDMGQSAAIAAALFVPHVIIPGMNNGSPCHGTMMMPMRGEGQGDDGQNAPMIPAGGDQ